MTGKIKERSVLSLLLFSVLTLGIYPIVFWNKVSKEVELLCEGDGKKTMKYVFVWLLNFITFGLAGVVWRAKLAQRLKENAARYDLRFSESGALTAFYEVVLFIAFLIGPCITRFILIKNLNAMGAAFNEYNGLASEAEAAE